MILVLNGIGVSDINAQENHIDRAAADSMRYVRGIADLKSRIALRGANSSLIYALAVDYSKIGVVDSSLKYLNMAADQGWIIVGALADPSFEAVRKDKQWAELGSKISKIWYEYYPNGNLDYAVALFQMERESRNLRQEMKNAKREYGVDSDEVAQLENEITVSDSLHAVRLDSLVQKLGWPEQNRVSQPALNAIITILLQAPPSYQKKYRDDVGKSVASGELPDRALRYLDRKIDKAGSR